MEVIPTKSQTYLAFRLYKEGKETHHLFPNFDLAGSPGGIFLKFREGHESFTNWWKFTFSRPFYWTPGDCAIFDNQGILLPYIVYSISPRIGCYLRVFATLLRKDMDSGSTLKYASFKVTWNFLPSRSYYFQIFLLKLPNPNLHRRTNEFLSSKGEYSFSRDSGTFMRF